MTTSDQKSFEKKGYIPEEAYSLKYATAFTNKLEAEAAPHFTLTKIRQIRGKRIYCVFVASDVKTESSQLTVRLANLGIKHHIVSDKRNSPITLTLAIGVGSLAMAAQHSYVQDKVASKFCLLMGTVTLGGTVGFMCADPENMLRGFGVGSATILGHIIAYKKFSTKKSSLCQTSVPIQAYSPPTQSPPPTTNAQDTKQVPTTRQPWRY